MPEMITKYPDSALANLKSAGAKCGEGLKPQILTKCPKDRFCVLPQGEICVYEIKEIHNMTQIIPADLTDLVSSVPSIYSTVNILLLLLSCLFGLIIGMWFKRKP